MSGASPDVTGILAGLVGFPTLSRTSNIELMRWVADRLAASGIAARILPGPDGDRANLHAVIGPDGPGGVILSGHTDVVPVDGQAWGSDPFVLREAQGRLYGRGTADMKGFVACVLALAARIDQTRLTRPIHIALSYDEEIGCVGVRPMIAQLKQELAPQRLCIIGEPTSMGVATSHKGKLAATCTCHGVAAHSALAPNGLNAIHLASDMIAALRRLQDEVAQGMPAPTADDVPYTTLHVGRIEGGVALNIVPEHCRFEFEIRNLPGQAPAPLLKRLHAAADDIANRNRFRFRSAAIDIEATNAYPALLTGSHEADVHAVLGMAGAASATRVAFGTEGGLFREALGCTTVVCGPGSMQQGHKPDEFVEIAQLEHCSRFLDRLVAQSCM